jgi:hypothetical protein
MHIEPTSAALRLTTTAIGRPPDAIHSTRRECRCGHLEADHQSNRAPLAGCLRFGVCLMPDCGCRGFTDAARRVGGCG